MLDVAIPPEWKRQWAEVSVHFHDPFKLRVMVLSVIAAAGLIAVYRPMSADIGILRRDLKAAEDRLAMIHELEHLRVARVKLLENLPEAGHINFWTEYLLTGIRESGVSLRTLESSLRKTKVGKLQGAYFDIEFAGAHDQIHKLVSWIESSKYFARVVKLKLKTDVSSIEGKLTVAALVAPQDKGKQKQAAAKAGVPNVQGAGNKQPKEVTDGN